VNTYTVEVVDSLSLLSLKVASNVFDLSSGLHHISIRDQMVRAQLAVRDLKRGDPSLDSLLIVGAGVAGIAAALEAVARGVSHVVVVEVGAEPFGLLRGVNQRYIGPFMYEWPSSFSGNQSYPDHGATPWSGKSASPLQWKSVNPVSGHTFARMLTKGLLSKLQAMSAGGTSPLTICVNVNKGSISDFVREFAKNESARAMSRLQKQKPAASLRFKYSHEAAWPLPNAASGTIKPQYVMLAAGMGKETIRLVKDDISGNPYRGANYDGKPFWTNDNLLRKGNLNSQISVFGGGDGALQDVLRALTYFAHPLHFIKFLERDASTKAALDGVRATLLSIDRQGRQFGSWTVRNAEYRTVDASCMAVALRLAKMSGVAKRVRAGIMLGKGTVSLFVRGQHFDKTYLLNRFLVYLIYACHGAAKVRNAGRVKFELLFQHRSIAYKTGPDGRHVVMIRSEAAAPGSSFEHACDVISVRYGIEPGSVPGSQLIQVSKEKSRQRTTLAHVELPFVAEKD
jgi:hypothetical protein